jgi:hypothetical protein
MKNETTELIRDKILMLIDSEYESDAAFERSFGIPEKTVNNWRRGLSASFMRMLPELSERFSMNVSELMNIPLRGDSSELSDDEIELLQLYRKTRTMPEKMRTALRTTLDTTINMYISAHHEMRRNERRIRAKEREHKEK